MKKVILLASLFFVSLTTFSQTRTQKDNLNDMYVHILKNPNVDNTKTIDKIVDLTYNITETNKYKFENLDLYRLHLQITTKTVSLSEYKLILRQMISSGWVHIESKETELPSVYKLTFCKVKE